MRLLDTYALEEETNTKNIQEPGTSVKVFRGPRVKKCFQSEDLHLPNSI